MVSDENIKSLIDSIGILNFEEADAVNHTITFGIFDMDYSIRRKWEIVYGSQKKNNYKLFLIWDREANGMYFKTDISDKKYPLKKVSGWEKLKGKAMMTVIDYITYKSQEIEDKGENK